MFLFSSLQKRQKNTYTAHFSSTFFRTVWENLNFNRHHVFRNLRWKNEIWSKSCNNNAREGDPGTLALLGLLGGERSLGLLRRRGCVKPACGWWFLLVFVSETTATATIFSANTAPPWRCLSSSGHLPSAGFPTSPASPSIPCTPSRWIPWWKRSSCGWATQTASSIRLFMVIFSLFSTPLTFLLLCSVAVAWKDGRNSFFLSAFATFPGMTNREYRAAFRRLLCSWKRRSKQSLTSFSHSRSDHTRSDQNEHTVFNTHETDLICMWRGLSTLSGSHVTRSLYLGWFGLCTLGDSVSVLWVIRSLYSGWFGLCTLGGSVSVPWVVRSLYPGWFGLCTLGGSLFPTWDFLPPPPPFPKSALITKCWDVISLRVFILRSSRADMLLTRWKFDFSRKNLF